jgi:hypothetical protein
MSIDREKILKQLARVMNQVAECAFKQEFLLDCCVQSNIAVLPSPKNAASGVQPWTILQ